MRLRFGTDAAAHGCLDREVIDAVARVFSRTAALQTAELENPQTF
jgi:hypothetical protein